MTTGARGATTDGAARAALAAAFGGIVALSAAPLPIADPDLFWHLAVGRDTLASGLGRTDAYSWTIVGRPVLVDQWLGQIAWYGAHALGGWSGVAALRALAGAIILAATFAAALAERPSRPLVATLACLPAMLLMRAAWSERPQLLAFVCFALCVLLLRRALGGAQPDGSARSETPVAALAWCVPLLAIWANLHGSYALGLVLVVLVALVLRTRAALAIAALATVATLATPMGLATPFASGGHFLQPPRFVQEEGVPDLLSPYGAVLGATLALVIGAAILGRTAPREAILIVPVTLVALTATRHGAYLGIVAAPFLAAHGPDALAALARALRLGFPAARPQAPPRAVAPIAGALAALAFAGALALSPNAPDERGFPVAALARLSPGPGLFNHYDWGGWLIWRAPATPVFVDGRVFPYAGETLGDFITIVEAHPGWRETIARRGIRTVLARPTDAVVVRGRELGWRVLASGDGFVLLEVR